MILKVWLCINIILTEYFLNVENRRDLVDNFPENRGKSG